MHLLDGIASFEFEMVIKQLMGIKTTCVLSKEAGWTIFPGIGRHFANMEDKGTKRITENTVHKFFLIFTSYILK